MYYFLQLHVNLQWSQNRKFKEKFHFTSLPGPALVSPVKFISVTPLSHIINDFFA